MCQSYDIKILEKLYDHTLETVRESEDATILWNMQIHTDCEIAGNKPDIVIKDHKTMTCKLFDMAVQSDRSTSVKVIEKLQIQRPRNWTNQDIRD